mgnify:CR=1 FL=1
MNFTECCSTCIGNAELVDEFNRLSGHKLGKPRSGIEKAIDKACGYDQDMAAMPDFVDFVYRCIWLLLIVKGRS